MALCSISELIAWSVVLSPSLGLRNLYMNVSWLSKSSLSAISTFGGDLKAAQSLFLRSFAQRIWRWIYAMVFMCDKLWTELVRDKISKRIWRSFVNDDTDI